MEEALADEGLTVRQFGALVHLSRDPGIGSGQLARLIIITPQSMGTLVQSLERAGFVERDSSAKPGTRIALRLTARGTQVMTRAMAIAGQVDAASTADLTAGEKASLNRMLHRILRSVKGSAGGEPSRR